MTKDEQEYTDFLTDIAYEVPEQITNSCSRKTYLQTVIKAFCEKNNESRQKFQMWEGIANNIIHCRMKDMGPPFEGFIWDGEDEFWRPVIFDPMAWVLRHFRGNPFNFFEKPTDPPNQSERLMCEYAVIAAIHDTYIKDLPECDKLYKTDNEEDIPALGSLTKLEEDNKPIRKGIRYNIDRAFNNVRKNLDKLPAEAEQDKKGRQSAGTTPGYEPKKIVAVTLIEFMEKYCQGSLLQSQLTNYKNSLLRANCRERINLPKLIGTPGKGQRYYYDPAKLKENWPSYRLFNLSLPLLKPSL